MSSVLFVISVALLAGLIWQSAGLSYWRDVAQGKRKLPVTEDKEEER